MIIDSHAHYAYSWYNGDFKCIDYKDSAFIKRELNLEELIKEMQSRGIAGFIEPSIGFKDIGNQLSLVKKHEGHMWAAVGVHPTRCINTPWESRKEVAKIAQREKIVAIGETGLDYHHKRKNQKRISQIRWFIYQIKLAHSLRLPMVLHIRKADRDGLAILGLFKNKLHGGVAHCFTGDSRLAMRFIKLGFAVGIGAKLLGDNEEGRALSDTVARIPMEYILVETDAPFVLPEASGELGEKKLCNSSLVLPAIIERIAALRGDSVENVEKAIYENTVRIFGLDKI